jgi:hypothetical protein
MGDIGPTRQLYDVLPGVRFGIEDADAWTAAPSATIPRPEPSPAPQPSPAPAPGPVPGPPPEPGPQPAPEPLPNPEPPQ